MSKRFINIAGDFSRILGPRFRKDGKYSGEVFLNKHLIPAMEANTSLEISLDGIDILSASFFEEAFGGLVRKYGFTEVSNKIKFTSTERAYLIPKIWAWMKAAEQ